MSPPTGMSSAPSTTAPAPSQYATLMADLSHQISDLRARAQGTNQGTTVLAADLTNADGNQGPYLLTPGAMDLVGTVIDRFQAMGITGASFEIDIPLLLPTFPDSATYLTFSKSVATEIRQHRMEADIEVSPAFPGFSTLAIDYKGMALQNYESQQAAKAQVIIDSLHPT